MAQKNDARTIAYSLWDILVHMFDAFMLSALDCPYCLANALRDEASETGRRCVTSRKGLTWTVAISPAA